MVSLSARVSAVIERLRPYIDFCLFEYEERKAQRTKPVYAFLGNGRAGKDTAAALLADIVPGITYGSSISRVMLPLMSVEVCRPMPEAWLHRHEDRQLWFNWINEFRNQLGYTVPVKLLLARCDVVVGIRALPELRACHEEGICDHFVWVHRDGVPSDPTMEYTSQTVLDLGGEVLVNNGTIEDLRTAVVDLVIQSFSNREKEENGKENR